MSRTCKEQRLGFTLVEIVVSITLLALIAIMITRVFNESSKTIGRGQDDALLEESARILLDYMEQDISQALIRTNVAFRIDPAPYNGTLSFVSPAARKLHSLIGRDTAPVRIQSLAAVDGNLPEYNRSLIEEAPDHSSARKTSTIRNLIAHSDYYDPDRRLLESINGAAVYRASYIQALSDELEDHAVLTFIEFKINGNPDFDGSLPSEENTPRFIDVSLGLITASELQVALLKNDQDQVRKNERLYSRRIRLTNRDPELISFR